MVHARPKVHAALLSSGRGCCDRDKDLRPESGGASASRSTSTPVPSPSPVQPGRAAWMLSYDRTDRVTSTPAAGA